MLLSETPLDKNFSITLQETLSEWHCFAAALSSGKPVCSSLMLAKNRNLLLYAATFFTECLYFTLFLLVLFPFQSFFYIARPVFWRILHCKDLGFMGGIFFVEKKLLGLRHQCMPITENLIRTLYLLNVLQCEPLQLLRTFFNTA